MRHGPYDVFVWDFDASGSIWERQDVPAEDLPECVDDAWEYLEVTGADEHLLAVVVKPSGAKPIGPRVP